MRANPNPRHPTELSARVQAALHHAKMDVPQLCTTAWEKGYHIRHNTLYVMLTGKTKTAKPETLWVIHRITGVAMADLDPRYKHPRNDLWPTLLEIQTLQERSSSEMAELCGVAMHTYHGIVSGQKTLAFILQRIRQNLGLPPIPAPEATPADAPVIPDAAIREPDAPLTPLLDEVVPLPPPKYAGEISVTLPPEPSTWFTTESFPTISAAPKVSTRQDRFALLHWTMVQAMRAMLDLAEDEKDGVDMSTRNEWEIALHLASAMNTLSDGVGSDERAQRVLRGLEILCDPHSRVEEHAIEILRLLYFSQNMDPYESISDVEDSLLSAFRIAVGQRKELQL